MSDLKENTQFGIQSIALRRDFVTHEKIKVGRKKQQN